MRFNMWLQAIASGPKGRWRVPERKPVSSPTQWEDIDTVGDNARFAMTRTNAGITGLVSLVCLALIVLGNGELRALSLMGFIFAGGVFLPTAIGLRNSVRRIKSDRGLVPGDPYRVEGVDPRG